MIKHFFAAITGNLISLVGTLMMVLSLLLIAALLVMQAMGFEGGAYIGIITFVVLPVMFLTGVAVGPLGIWLLHRREARAAAEGRPIGQLPVIDLNKETTRGVLLGFTALSVPIIAIASGLTYKAVHFITFCRIRKKRDESFHFASFSASEPVHMFILL